MIGAGPCRPASACAYGRNGPNGGYPGAHRHHRAWSRNCRHRNRRSSCQTWPVGYLDRPAASRGRGPPTAMPASSKAIRFFPRPFRRALPNSRASPSSARRRPTTIWRICRGWRRGCWHFAPHPQPARLIETCKSDAAVIGARRRRARGARRRSGCRAAPQPPRLAQALSYRQRVRRAGAGTRICGRALASPTCRSTATARWRSNRR